MLGEQRVRAGRRIGFLALVGVLALSVGVASASAGGGKGGNSANAKLCYKNGWQSLYTSTGAAFTSEEACVSYAAQGGTLTSKTKSQLDCESLGGTFSTDPSTNGAVGGQIAVVWTCNGWSYADFNAFRADVHLLGIDCGTGFGAVATADTSGTANGTCYITPDTP